MWEDSDTDTRQKGNHEEEERAGRMSSRQWKKRRPRSSSALQKILFPVTHRGDSQNAE